MCSTGELWQELKEWPKNNRNMRKQSNKREGIENEGEWVKEEHREIKINIKIPYLKSRNIQECSSTQKCMDLTKTFLAC